MAPEKTCGPATTLSFAGIELDSICSEARLPIDKIHKST